MRRIGLAALAAVPRHRVGQGRWASSTPAPRTATDVDRLRAAFVRSGTPRSQQDLVAALTAVRTPADGSVPASWEAPYVSAVLAAVLSVGLDAALAPLAATALRWAVMRPRDLSPAAASIAAAAASEYGAIVGMTRPEDFVAVCTAHVAPLLRDQSLPTLLHLAAFLPRGHYAGVASLQGALSFARRPNVTLAAADTALLAQAIARHHQAVSVVPEDVTLLSKIPAGELSLLSALRLAAALEPLQGVLLSPSEVTAVKDKLAPVLTVALSKASGHETLAVAARVAATPLWADVLAPVVADAARGLCETADSSMPLAIVAAVAGPCTPEVVAERCKTMVAAKDAGWASTPWVVAHAAAAAGQASDALVERCIAACDDAAPGVLGHPVALAGVLRAASPAVVSQHAVAVCTAAQRGVPWNLNETAVVLHAVAGAETAQSRAAIRELAPTLVPSVPHATPTATAALWSALGASRVRHDGLCAALSDRSVALRDELHMPHIAAMAGAFDRLDYRHTKPLLDLVARLRGLTPTATPREAALTMWGYGRAAVWQFRVYAGLIERLTAAAPFATLQDHFLALQTVIRLDFPCEEYHAVAQRFVAAHIESLDIADCVECAVLLSKLHASADETLFRCLADRLVAESATLTATQLGEALLSFTRAGFPASVALDSLKARALAVVPSAPLPAVANIVSAFAGAAQPEPELFALAADRTLQLRDEAPALTIAAVLVAFASVGIRNDKLFVEMIPRVRLVAHHGSPADVANVVTAYSTVGVWHYKLFVRLGERAIAVRADCKPRHISQILRGFAKVGMHFDKLLTELSPRIQALMPLCAVEDVVAIVDAFSKLCPGDKAVFDYAAMRALQLRNDFEPSEAAEVLRAFRRAKQQSPELFDALAEFDPGCEPSPVPPPITSVEAPEEPLSKMAPPLVGDEK